MEKPPRRYKKTSFYFCLAGGAIALMNGLGRLTSLNVYEQEGWAGFLALAFLFFLGAFLLKRRNDAADRACDEVELRRIENDRLMAEHLRADRERESAEKSAKKEEWERTHGRIETSLVGVTFNNEDGSSRQRALQDALANDCRGTLDIEAYDRDGEQAVRVLYEGTQIGNIPKNRAVEVAEICDRISSASLRVVPFRPEDDEGRGIGGVIYRAELTLVWLK